MVDWAALILFPLIVLIFGMLGGLITSKKIPTWYKYLQKPSLTPPNWMFPVVWTTLYLMIGISGYIVYETNGTGFSSDKTDAWICYFMQLILNFLWTPLFFGLNWLFIAGIEIIALDIFIWANITYFMKLSVLAGSLLIPYCIWVSFASYLCWYIWYYNRDINPNIETLKENE